MEDTIFNFQQNNAADIENVLAKYRGTDEWNKAQNAFKEIIRTYVHGGMKNMSDDELNKHFEQAVTATQLDVNTFLNKSNSVLMSQRDASSPYYMVNVEHHRNDVNFATNQSCPITGAGKQRLNARFNAQNLYQRYDVNATSTMPPRIAKSSFPNWGSIATAMTDRTAFDKTFYLTNSQQADAVFAVTSALDWSKVQGALFMTPDLFDGAVFSPALYSVYFFGADAGALKNIYFFVTADGQGNPEKPFIGLIQEATDADQIVYQSINRFAFSYLSDAANPVKYWMDANDAQLLDYTLNVQTFYPGHTDTPYIEVNAHFSAQVSPSQIAYFKDIPGLSTILLIQKGTLMKDLVKAYFPGSTSAQLWEDLGVLTGNQKWLNDLKAIGLDAMSDIFASNVWEEKPVVTPT